MNATRTLDIHALTATITTADLDYFAHAATRHAGGIVANPVTLARLANIAGSNHPAAAGYLTRKLRVPVVPDPSIPVGVVTIQPMTEDAPSV